jgi:hypothetical protein
MGALSLAGALAVRIYHFLLCSLIIFGALFSTSQWECLIILGLLVIVSASQQAYKRCVFTEYEKIDGLPSMSELMKTIVFPWDATVPLWSFELLLTNIFIFIVCFRMASMAIISPKILFA